MPDESPPKLGSKVSSIRLDAMQRISLQDHFRRLEGPACGVAETRGQPLGGLGPRTGQVGKLPFQLFPAERRGIAVRGSS